MFYKSKFCIRKIADGIFIIVGFVLSILTSYSQKMPLLATPSEISTYGEVTYFQGQPFTGKLITEKGDKDIGEYKNGLKHGVFKEYFPNGKNKSENKFNNGKLNGKSIIYDELGKVELEQDYSNGEKISEKFFKNGKLFESSKLFVEYYTDGNIKSKGWLKNDVLEGFFESWFKNGQKEFVGFYLNGKKKNGTMYYDDGLSYSGDWIDDKVVGYGTIVWPEGKKYVGFIESNLMHGKGTMYNSNGQIEHEGFWKNGVEDVIAGNLISNNKNLLYSCFINLGNVLQHEIFRLSFRNFSGDLSDDAKDIIEGEFKNAVYKGGPSAPGRFKSMSSYNFDSFINDTITFEIILENLVIEKSNITCRQAYSGSNNQVLYKNIPGFKIAFSLNFIVKDAKGATKKNKKIYNSAESCYSYENALWKALQWLIRKNIFEIFPIKTTIIEIIKKSGNNLVSEVSIMGGTDNGIKEPKGLIRELFVIMDEQNNIIGKLKVKEVGFDKTLCKIIEGEEIITSYLNSRKQLIVKYID